MIGGAVRWATNKVDENVVSPVATRLANSVANPFVLSYFVWERVKEMTPQRARDLSRLVSTAVANAVGVFGAEKGAALKLSTKRLQDEFVGAAVSRQGREVVLNTVATASKVVQALNTPETKAATLQVFETLQSIIDFFASEPGRKVIATAGECVTQLCDVAASPESSIFLAEIATNICHSLDAEAQRRDTAFEAAAAAAVSGAKHVDGDRGFADLEDKPNAAPPSPTWSNADTAFETESNFSETPFGARSRAGSHVPRRTQQPQQQQPREKRGARSARIEKEVLLKMGVEPAMIGEIQRILDAVAAEEETALMRAEDAAGLYASDFDETFTDDDGDDDGAESTISFAFGLQSPAPTSFVAADAEQQPSDQGDATNVVLPEWHDDSLRQALRRRHVRDAERVAQRNTSETQAREIATVLAQRQVRPGDLAPIDAFACRAISVMLVSSVAVVLLLVVFSVYRSLFYGF